MIIIIYVWGFFSVLYTWWIHSKCKLSVSLFSSSFFSVCRSVRRCETIISWCLVPNWYNTIFAYRCVWLAIIIRFSSSQSLASSLSLSLHAELYMHHSLVSDRNFVFGKEGRRICGFFSLHIVCWMCVVMFSWVLFFI